MSEEDTDTVYCRQCGSEIRTDVDFCPSCGGEQPDTATTENTSTDSTEHNSTTSGSSTDGYVEKESTQDTPDGSQSYTEFDLVDVEPSTLLFSNLNDDRKYCHGCGESRHRKQRQCQNCHTELIDSESTYADYDDAKAKKCLDCGVAVPVNFTYCYNCGKPDTNLVNESPETSEDSESTISKVGVQTISKVGKQSGKFSVEVIDGIVVLIGGLLALEVLWANFTGGSSALSFILMIFFLAVHGVIVVGKSIVYE